ncbi:MAG: PBP1A family penicillin-binding protein [Deltaproteobacteria bacterium]|nr:PBP1A family penicillin-binding protein [Deltaproteobacteria bacterium]
MANARKRKTTARKRSSTTKRRSKSRRRPTKRVSGWLRKLIWLGVVVGFVAGFACSVVVIRLDRIVQARFDGQRFRVPSRVYSAPSILYPGLDIKLADLRGTLTRLGYREAGSGGSVPEGQYSWQKLRIRVHLRAFEHPTRSEPARDVVFRILDGTIEEILELPAGRTVGAVLVEPEQLGAYYGPSREQRELVGLDDLPPHLVDAIVAVEDQRFEAHPGIDVRRIGGALLANLRAGGIRQGGSTLTQQLVKNFFLTPERTLKRKAHEAVMALLVELRYDKREILETYLNEIYLGQRGSTEIHGVGEATLRFFGKRVRNLSLAESALLAALIQSPNGISPYRNPDGARKRRDLVLQLMAEQGRIGASERDAAIAEPLSLAAITPDAGDARYFLDFLRLQLSDDYNATVLSSQGIKVYSTLESRTQRLAATALREGIEKLERQHPALVTDDPIRALQGCIVAIRPQTGEIVALVGGRDYQLSQFDRCTQARRPAGSAFKPFVFIAALEPRAGGPTITLASFLDDSPLEIGTPSGLWKPRNFDRKFHGTVSVREALERSFNVATARLAQEIGIGRVADVARRMGIESPLPLVPSLALGVADVSPLEMVRAYATLAGGGVRPQVRSIEDLVDPAGETLERREFHHKRVIDSGTAYLATSLLQGVAHRGTAAGVRSTGIEGPIAAKTGTSDEERDLWFVGYTPELVVAVWLGFDEPRSIGFASSRGALPIWRRFVDDLTGGQIHGQFPRPPSIVVADVDPVTGARALRGCPDRRRELFLEGTLPEEVCPRGADADLDDDGFQRTQERFFEWLRKHL